MIRRISALLLVLCLLCGCGNGIVGKSAVSNVDFDSYLFPYAPISETLRGFPIQTEYADSLLDIEYVIPPLSKGYVVWEEEICMARPLEWVTSFTHTFFTRFAANALPYGLNRFCPTFSYVFSNNGRYDSFLDIHVREKDGKIGENFSHLCRFPGYSISDFLADDVMSVDSYHDAADFCDKNFSAAMAGDDPEYTGFTRLEDVDVNGLVVYHYNFTRSGYPDESLKDSKNVDIVYEKYGEQYLFETEQYIYVFAFSGQEADEKMLTTLRCIVDSIEIKERDAAFPTAWEQDMWIQKNLLDHLQAAELTGSVPEIVQSFLNENS